MSRFPIAMEKNKRVIVLFNYRAETGWKVLMLSYSYVCAIFVLQSEIPGICLALVTFAAL